MLSIGTGVGVTDVGSVPGFWASGLGHFWDEQAYNASPNRVKQLLTVSSMAALGYTSATATTNPPATVIGSAGTLQYAAHNLVQQSENISAAWWSATNGSATNATTYAENTSNAIHRFYPNGPASVAAGSTVTVAASLWAGTRRYVAIGANNSNDDVFVVVDTQTWTITQSSARGAGVNLGSKLTSLGNGEYRVSVTGYIPGIAQYFPIVMASDTGTPGSLVYSYIGNSSTIIVSKLQHNWGYPVDYVATTTAPVYAAPITYDRGASSNVLPYSETFSNGVWTQSRATAAVAAISPPAACAVAYTLTEDNSVGTDHRIYTTAPATPTGQLSWSVFMKAGTRTWGFLRIDRSGGTTPYVWFDLANGKVGTAETGMTGQIQAVGGGWYRCTATIDNTTGSSHPMIGIATANATYGYTGDNASFIYIAGAHLNAGLPTPYLKTGATAPLYTAGTPKSQNLASGSATQSVTVFPGCVYSILHQSGGTYTLSGAATGTTTAGSTTTFVAATATLTLTASSTPTLLQVWEGTGTMAYVAGPYSLYYQQGLITEAARTRETLHPRDLTQAAWFKSGSMTAAKTATGIDGVPNSCTTLTSSAGSWAAYLYQPITSASANRLMPFWVRSRSAASVTFRASVNGGTTNTVLVATPQWAPVMLSGAAITNPSYLIALQNNGDSIDVDFVQGEQYTTLPSVPPMPIWGTESAAQTKSQDLILEPASAISDIGPQTTVVRCTPRAATTGAAQILLGRGGGGFVAYLHSAVGAPAIYDGTNLALNGTAVVGGVPAVVATRYSTGGGLGVCLNGGAIVTSSFDGSMGTAGTQGGVGHDGSGNAPFSGLIGSIEIANSAFSDANLQLASLGLLA